MSVSGLITRQLFYAIVCLMPAWAWCQTAYLHPEEISEGDTTVLVIEIEGNTPSLHSLDTTALEDNFEILGTSSRVKVEQQQNRVVNKTRWEIELFPLKTGKLEIPPLDIAGRLTPALSLTVKAPAAGQGLAGVKDVFIQMSTEPENPYVGQQTNIILKLFHNVRIVNGTLSEPEAVNADVYRIGNDISYSQTLDGAQYNVLERSFALFANSPGQLQLLPVSFRGQIEVPGDDSSSSFSSFMRQVKQIKRSSNPLSLDVKGIPSAYTGKYWLPANDLRISEQWSEQAGEFQVGDSLNRSVKVIADGLPAEALPNDLYDSADSTVNIYPDKASRSNQDIGKKLVGIIEQKFALILPQAGDVTIPPLQLTWWDVDEQVEKQAILPERKLTVTGGSADPKQSPVAQNDSSPTADSFSQQRSESINYWQWLAFALLLAWLLTLLLWYRSRSVKPLPKQEQSVVPEFQRKSLQQACQAGNPVLARNELIAWARQTWPEQAIAGLYKLKANTQSAEFKQEIDKLDRALYSQNQSGWSGDSLWQAFLTENTKAKGHTDPVVPAAIPPLYSQ